MVALTGCSPSDTGGGAGVTSTPQASSTAAAEADPDQVALDRAVALTEDLLALLAASRPGADPGGRLVAMHRVHLAALTTASGPAATSSATASPSPDATPGPADRPLVRRREAAAQRELAAMARAARSGALARLFASMAAGIAGHLALGASP